MSEKASVVDEDVIEQPHEDDDDERDVWLSILLLTNRTCASFAVNPGKYQVLIVS